MRKLSIKDRILRRLGLDVSGETPANWHEDFVVHLAQILRPQTYVELGLYKCQVFNRVSKIADISIGIDIEPDAVALMKKSTNNYFIGKSTADALDKVENILGGKGIDMIFIDADHSRESVLTDFNNYFPLVNENGLILMHDAYPMSEEMTSKGYCGDGYKAIYELSLQRDTFELVTIPHHPGLAICRKRSKQLSWE